MYRAPFIILYYDQPMHNYFTNYHTATCFDTIVSFSDRFYASSHTIVVEISVTSTYRLYIQPPQTDFMRIVAAK
jgi:hypothetical protein